MNDMGKFTKMYEVHYEEVLEDMRIRKSIFTTLAIPELHKYLESRLNVGKVTILHYEEKTLLTDIHEAK